MKKKRETKPGDGLAAVGALTAICVLECFLAAAEGSPSRIVSGSIARAIVCTVLFLSMLYQRKRPETQSKGSLLAMGLLTAVCILDFALAVIGGSSSRIVSRRFAGAAVCTALFPYMIYQRWKNRK
ncbi:MAG: hypothetical protein K2P01_08150 [Oscillospiraceae bacterium]|nr:hypothetical protein [Oscillospiraceae bacterium]